MQVLLQGVFLSGYQPSHDIDKFVFSEDLKFGQRGEQMFTEFLEDLESGSFEVKYDRYRNGRMVVETEQNPRNEGWQLSGINVTTAMWWIYVFAPHTFIAVQVPRLKKFLRANKLPKTSFALNSENPARGYLLYPKQITDLMTNKDYDTE
jgi:dipeptidase